MWREISPPHRPRKAAATQAEQTEEQRAEQGLSHYQTKYDRSIPRRSTVAVRRGRRGALLARSRRRRDALWTSRWDGGATRWRCARLGWRVFGVDVDLDAVRTARDRAAAEGLVVRAWCADLAVTPLPSASVRVGGGDALSAARSLRVDSRRRDARRRRPLRDVHVAPARARRSVRHRRITCSSRASCARRFDGFDVLFYEEVLGPEAVARLVARRPRSARSGLKAGTARTLRDIVGGIRLVAALRTWRPASAGPSRGGQGFQPFERVARQATRCRPSGRRETGPRDSPSRQRRRCRPCRRARRTATWSSAS